MKCQKHVTLKYIFTLKYINLNTKAFTRDSIIFNTLTSYLSVFKLFKCLQETAIFEDKTLIEKLKGGIKK